MSNTSIAPLYLRLTRLRQTTLVSAQLRSQSFNEKLYGSYYLIAELNRLPLAVARPPSRWARRESLGAKCACGQYLQLVTREPEQHLARVHFRH
jgi:hypothetical protein